MKLLLVGSYAESLINFRGDLISDFICRGFSVFVAAPGLKKETILRKQLEEKGCTVLSIPMQRTGKNPLFDLYSLLYLIYLNYKFKPDIFLSYTIKPVIYGLIASRITRVPNRCAMITGLGYAFSVNSDSNILTINIFKKLTYLLYKISLSFAKCVIFQNNDDKDLFIRLNLVNQFKNKILVTGGSGVSLERFQFKPIKEGGLNYLMITRFLIDKGIREYFEAAKIISQNYSGVTFSLAGWLDEGPNALAQKEFNAYLSNSNVQYLGRVEDVREALENCSVYVLPSYREGTPRTVLEAMSIGRPVITTDAPGCRETVIDGVNGFLVPIRSIDGLVQAMKKFIENPHLVFHMGSNGRVLAENKFDVNVINKNIIESIIS